MSACCVVGCQFIAHTKCSDFVHSAAHIADRTRSIANLDWTCPTCLHIKIDIRAFMRQMELEFQALRAGFTDLLSRFNGCDSNFKSRIHLSQSSFNINRCTTLPNVSFYFPDLSNNLSNATVQSLTDSLIVVSPESLRPTNRSLAVATSEALLNLVLPLAYTTAPPPVPLTSMIPRKSTHSPALSFPLPLTLMVPRKSVFVSTLN